MGDGKRGPLVQRLQQLYMQLLKQESQKGPRI
jgi:hypothetical protein